jgi:DNA-binding transcriptional MocR family regulator
LFEIELDLGPKGSRESSRTLHRELKAAILDGRLTAGARLPATRKSAAFFGVSRNTAAMDLESVADELLEQNVKIHALSRYFLGPQTRAGLVFGYGTVDLSEIRRRVSVLRGVLPPGCLGMTKRTCRNYTGYGRPVQRCKVRCG